MSMNFRKRSFRSLAVALAATTTMALGSSAYAVITSLTSAASFIAGTQDSFSDLATNSSVGSPITRIGNGVAYTLTGFSAAGSQLVSLYGLSPGAISTDYFTDYLALSPSGGAQFYALGFTLYGTQNDGSTLAGSFNVRVVNALSETVNRTVSTSGSTTFVGYASSAPITNVTITNSAAATATYITLDNLYLSAVAVPEPSTVLLLGLGFALLGAVRRGRI